VNMRIGLKIYKQQNYYKFKYIELIQSYIDGYDTEIV
jgi:hypothetical protein